MRTERTEEENSFAYVLFQDSMVSVGRVMKNSSEGFKTQSTRMDTKEKSVPLTPPWKVPGSGESVEYGQKHGAVKGILVKLMNKVFTVLTFYKYPHPREKAKVYYQEKWKQSVLRL